MAAISSNGGLTPSSLETIIWLVVAIAVLFSFSRFAIRLYALHKLLWDDIAVALAVLLLLIQAIMYHFVLPIIFELDRIATGQEMFTPAFLPRATEYLKLQFALIVIFWTMLWTVKVAFLIFYRILFAGLPDHLLGACQTPRDIHYSNACLYVAAAADIASDLLSQCSGHPQATTDIRVVMSLGLRLLHNLKISLKEKLMLGAVFSVGLIKIAFAVIRVVKVGASAEHVNPIWLALWSMVEASVAVVVVCLPSFKALFARGHRQHGRHRPIPLRLFHRRLSKQQSNDMTQPLDSERHPTAPQNPTPDYHGIR
ncbi:MAG: hypothetical protein Q9220_004047 [cf. Caloplaca sp. 1 TL-2023]